MLRLDGQEDVAKSLESVDTVVRICSQVRLSITKFTVADKLLLEYLLLNHSEKLAAGRFMFRTVLTDSADFSEYMLRFNSLLSKNDRSIFKNIVINTFTDDYVPMLECLPNIETLQIVVNEYQSVDLPETVQGKLGQLQL